MKCPKCGYELFPFDTKCDRCGTAITPNSEPDNAANVPDKSVNGTVTAAVDGDTAANGNNVNTASLKKVKPIVQRTVVPGEKPAKPKKAPETSKAPKAPKVPKQPKVKQPKQPKVKPQKTPKAPKAPKTDNPNNSTKKNVIIGVSVGVVAIALVVLMILLNPIELIMNLLKKDEHVHDYLDGVCIECGESDPNYVPHEHDYAEAVTEPTCTDQGYTTYTCSCGDEYTDDWTEPNGHSYEAIVNEPTCTTDGFTIYTCSVCNDMYEDDPVDALGHTYEDGVCTVCGEPEPEETEDEASDDETEEDENTEEEAEDETATVEENTDEEDTEDSGTPNDKIPKTGESNMPILLIMFAVFSVIGLGYSVYIFVYPSKEE